MKFLGSLLFSLLFCSTLFSDTFIRSSNSEFDSFLRRNAGYFYEASTELYFIGYQSTLQTPDEEALNSAIGGFLGSSYDADLGWEDWSQRTDIEPEIIEFGIELCGRLQEILREVNRDNFIGNLEKTLKRFNEISKLYLDQL